MIKCLHPGTTCVRSIWGCAQLAPCLVECKHVSTKRSLCRLLPGLTGVTLYAHPYHGTPDPSEWVGWWEVTARRAHTTLSHVLPRDPSKCLQGKEKRLKDTLNWKSSVERRHNVTCARTTGADSSQVSARGFVSELLNSLGLGGKFLT